MRRAGQENPATFLKCLVHLVPKELQVEPAGSIISKLSDEQLAEMIAALDVKIALAKQAAGENAKLINAHAEPAAKESIASAPDAPYRKSNPKSSPRELEYARVYASRRRAALRAQAAAAPEPPNETTSESDL